jgi:DNA replication protein DnaC
MSVAIAHSGIRNGARGFFFNVADLVNKLEAGQSQALPILPAGCEIARLFPTCTR